MSKDEIRTLVTSLGNLLAVLAHADPQGKAEIYSELGLALTYRPAEKRVVAQVKPNIVDDLRAGGAHFDASAAVRAGR